MNFKLLLSLFLILCVAMPARALTDAEIDMRLNRMSVAEKIGQLLIVGIGGKQVSSVAEAHITKRFVGGFILFGRNIQTPKQVAALTSGLQQVAQQTPNAIPLFMAIDQEGGNVVRLEKGATVLPGNLALGATGSQALAEKAGELTAIELAAVGVNLNFAPVMDVNTDPRNPVIGVRAYGESPTLVSQLGKAYIRGLQRNGVMATAKHFPGHGDTDVDSHKNLPIVTHEKERISTVELVPFRAAIASGVAAIMSAHILYPALDDELPTTLSHKILTKLLRQQLGFEGLIITDDMEMQAIDAQYEIGNAAVLAIQAGADIVLMSGTLKKQQRVYNALRQAVRSGDISETHLNTAVRRILKTKNTWGLFERAAGDENLSRVGSTAHRKIAETIATRAITLVKNTDGLLPLAEAPQEQVLLISPSRAFSKAFFRAHTDLTNISDVLLPLQADAQKTIHEFLQTKTSVIVAGIANVQQANLIHQLSQKTGVPIVVVSITSPYLLGKCPDVACAIAAYNGNTYSLVAAMEVLFGKRQATGKLPVTIP